MLSVGARIDILVCVGGQGMGRKIVARLQRLGIKLPSPPAPVGAYAGVVRTGNLLITSGQLPWVGNQLAFEGPVGGKLPETDGYEAARLCAINALAQLKSAVGDLDRISHIVRLEGYVYSAPGFRGQPQVLNGASELFVEVFGDQGRHARTALALTEMPLSAAVQLVVWAEVAD